MARARGIFRAFGMAMGMAACARTPGGPPSEPKPPTAGEQATAVKCAATGPVMELPTVALDPGSRRELAAELEAGVVAVRFRAEGCKMELELLPHCVGTPKYEYQPFWSAKTNTEIVHDAQELAFKLPLGAEKLGGMLGGDRVLRTDSLVVGVAAVPDGAQVRFVGPDCERATHAVRKFYLGGFAMVRGASRLLEGGTSVFRTGDASQTNEVERVAQEGDPAECEQAAKQGTRRQQCAVPVRIRIVPLKRVVWDAPKAPASASSRPSAATFARMVWIPAGTFAMGSNDRLPNDQPVHQVKLASYEIDVTEVTVAAYERCVRAGPCKQAKSGHACNAGVAGREQHPINCVDWDQANAYCAWAGKRLPTEEEWEYAARGTDGRQYPWGNKAPRSVLCWGGEGIVVGRPDHGSTCEVDAYPSGSSPFGLRDMAGNVAEWTASEWCDLRAGRKVCSSTLRLQRGGNWANSAPETVRAAHREATWVGASGVDLGFRCARGRPSATTPGRMARIPAGTCQVGSNDRLLNEEPVRTVTLQSFEMDVTEVTVAEYEICVRAAKCSQAPTVRTCNAGKAERQQHPINCIEFTDAKAYCMWAGKRLPTEEEWEYAARGAEGRVYPWGKAPPGKQLCWNGEGNDAGKGNRTSTCPVGTYPSGDGPFGLHDMAGNVAEYASSGSGKGGVGVVRGGGFTEFVDQYVNPARRRFDFGRSESVGFRCARSL